jgi:hypothetical protein
MTNLVEISEPTAPNSNLIELTAAIQLELAKVRQNWDSNFEGRGGEIILCENGYVAQKVFNTIHEAATADKKNTIFLIKELSDGTFEETTSTLIKIRDLSTFTVVTITAAGRGIDYVSMVNSHVIICSEPMSIYEL